MNFVCYLLGWALYRIKKWMGYLYAQRKKGTPVPALHYFDVYGPLVIRDFVTQVVIGLAWVTGMLDKLLTTTLAAAGLTMPDSMSAAESRAFAALVGYVAASVLSELIMKRLTPRGENGEAK
jgi:hypothetical protein